MVEKAWETQKDLEALVRGGNFTVTDIDGVVHKLQLLDLQDFSDFQVRGSATTVVLDGPVLQYVLWLAMRREGCSADAVEREEYKYSLARLGRMFTVSQIRESGDTVLKLMKASGWIPEDFDPEDPEGKNKKVADPIPDGAGATSGQP